MGGWWWWSRLLAIVMLGLSKEVVTDERAACGLSFGMASWTQVHGDKPRLGRGHQPPPRLSSRSVHSRELPDRNLPCRFLVGRNLLNLSCFLSWTTATLELKTLDLRPLSLHFNISATSPNMVLKQIHTTEDDGILLLPLTPAQAHVREGAGDAIQRRPVHIEDIQLVPCTRWMSRTRIVCWDVAVRTTGPMLITVPLTANRRYCRRDAREYQQGLTAR